MPIYENARMVTVKLKVHSPLNGDFLRWLYPADADGSLRVKSDTLGRLIVSHCRVSDRPVESPPGGDVFTLALPRNAASQSLEDKWTYYTAGDTAAINSAISACFDLDFRGYYIRGLELGVRKKDIIEAYIVSRGLFSAACFDALHKRAYRRDLERMSKLTDRLLRKAYYITESIDYKGLEPYDKNH